MVQADLLLSRSTTGNLVFGERDVTLRSDFKAKRWLETSLGIRRLILRHYFNQVKVKVKLSRYRPKPALADPVG
jgi:hypothetical protein